MTTDNRIVVDVIVFAFNHELFIEDALTSIINQSISRNIRVIFHDDGSKDATLDLARRVLERSGVTHEIYSQEVNQHQLGSKFRWEVINSGSAEYIAFLDGDDYWSDEKKLELQVGQLSRHREASLSHHLFSSVDEAGRRETFYPPQKFRKELLEGISLSDHNFIGTSTVMIRRSALPEILPKGYDDCKVDDYPIWSLVCAGSFLAFLDRDMTFYRLHENQTYANLEFETQQAHLLRALVYIANSVSKSEYPSWEAQLLRVAASKYLRNSSTSKLFKAVWVALRAKARARILRFLPL